MTPGTIRIDGAVLFAGGLWVAAVLIDSWILAAFLRPADRPVPEASGAGDGETERRLGGHPARRAALTPSLPPEVRLKAGRPALRFRMVADAPQWSEPRAGLRGDGAAAGHAPARRDVSPLEHTVAPGDTLTSIARTYYGSSAAWPGIAEANGMEPPYVLEVGKRLRLPRASVVSAEARVCLSAPAESASETAARRLTGRPPPPPPARLEAGERGEGDDGLLLVHPVMEAFPWEVPAACALAFPVLAAAAALRSLGRARARRPRECVGRLARGAFAAGGAAALLGGLAALGAESLASSPALQAASAVGAGAATGLASYGTALFRGPREGEADVRLDAEFAATLSVLVAGALLLCTAAGWTAVALDALRLPG